MCLINVNYHDSFSQDLVNAYHPVSLSQERCNIFCCCYFREILMLDTIKTGICEKLVRYFALEKCTKQPEKLMLMHTVQNASRFRVGKSVG